MSSSFVSLTIYKLKIRLFFKYFEEAIEPLSMAKHVQRAEQHKPGLMVDQSSATEHQRFRRFEIVCTYIADGGMILHHY